MMKMNMPTEDAQDCMRELGERSMGNWFENMDKMDIQAERKNTAEARKELAEAKSKLLGAVISIINITKKYSGTREEAICEIVKSVEMSQEEAKQLVEKYW